MGTLSTESGAVADVRSQLWLGSVTTTNASGHAQDRGSVRLRVDFQGLMTVANTGQTSDTAGGAVFFEYNAGYPVGSKVCTLMAVDTDPAAIAGRYCWRQVGTATLFDRPLGRPAQLQPGQAQTVKIEPTPPPYGMSVDAPKTESGPVGEALQNPAVLLVTTTDIAHIGDSAQLREACRIDAGEQPTAPGSPAPAAKKEQHVIVSSTSPIACSALPPLSS